MAKKDMLKFMSSKCWAMDVYFVLAVIDEEKSLNTPGFIASACSYVATYYFKD